MKLCKNLKIDLLWSLHIRTTGLLSAFLNTLKKTDVYSWESLEAKTLSPNGPRPPLTEAFFVLQSHWAWVHLGLYSSALLMSVISKVISTSACAAVTPVTSCSSPASSRLSNTFTGGLLRSCSSSLTGHCTSCFPDPSRYIFLGIACKMNPDKVSLTINDLTTHQVHS